MDESDAAVIAEWQAQNEEYQRDLKTMRRSWLYRAWCCLAYAIWTRLPHSISLDTKAGMWLLQYAGWWAYR